MVNTDDELQIILGPGKAQTASDMMNDMINSGLQSEPESRGVADLQALASQN